MAMKSRRTTWYSCSWLLNNISYCLLCSSTVHVCVSVLSHVSCCCCRSVLVARTTLCKHLLQRVVSPELSCWQRGRQSRKSRVEVFLIHRDVTAVRGRDVMRCGDVSSSDVTSRLWGVLHQCRLTCHTHRHWQSSVSFPLRSRAKPRRTGNFLHFKALGSVFLCSFLQNILLMKIPGKNVLCPGHWTLLVDLFAFMTGSWLT